jgi:hypothetical protein
LTPGFDPLAVFRAAEVSLVLGPLEPTALAFGLAALAAVGLGAVALVAPVAPVRLIKLTAVQALTPARSLHGVTQKSEPPSVQGSGEKQANQPGDRRRTNKMKKSFSLML